MLGVSKEYFPCPACRELVAIEVTATGFNEFHASIPQNPQECGCNVSRDKFAMQVIATMILMPK